MQTLFRTFLALTHNDQQSMYGNALSKMIRQVDRLIALVALQFTPEPGRTEALRNVAPLYVEESSPSEVAAGLATTPEPNVRAGLRIDWSGAWPTIAGA